VPKSATRTTHLTHHISSRGQTVIESRTAKKVYSDREGFFASLIRPITPGGFPEFVGDAVLSKFVQPGSKAVDLGTGYGAMAERLQNMGCDVLATDLSRPRSPTWSSTLTNLISLHG
jgi:2-polyprenyl-3-methyl-5-hydroxy-6-metoxy-1,4-benzoquinol methylase